MRLYRRQDEGDAVMFQLDTDDDLHAVGVLDGNAIRMARGSVIDAVLTTIQGMLESVECRRRGEPMIACHMRPRARGGAWRLVAMVDSENRTAQLEGDDAIFAWADLEYQA